MKNSKFKNEYLEIQKEKIEKENITTKLININKVIKYMKIIVVYFVVKKKK